MTDEQLVAYADAGQDRLEAERAFDRQVEAVRMGTIFAAGKEGHRAYQRWVSRARGRARKAFSPEQLESVVLALARTNPEYVVMGAG